MKGGRKNWDEDETEATNDTPQEGRNNRRTLLITGGKLGCRPDAMRVLGGYGFMADFPVERFYRDAPLMMIGEGTNEIQALVIARGLLIRYAI